MAVDLQSTDDKEVIALLTDEALNRRDPGVRCCRQLLYRNWVSQETLVPEAEIVRGKYDGLDVHLDLAHMDVAVRMADGSIYRPGRDLVGIKGLPLCLLLKLMRCPGLFKTPYDIGNMPPYHESHFINENIVQYVARLRRNLFHEDKNHERFLLTLRDPYRVAFNGELSFCLIEPAAELTEQTSRSE